MYTRRSILPNPDHPSATFPPPVDLPGRSSSCALLENSGKSVTLETSSLTKFLRCVFRDEASAIFGNLESAKPRSRELAIFRNLESAKPRSRELAIFRNLESVKPWSHEHAKIWKLEPAKLRTSGNGKFENLSEAWFGSREQGKFTNQGEAKSKLSSQKVRV
jgi:hypothetical protein